MTFIGKSTKESSNCASNTSALVGFNDWKLVKVLLSISDNLPRVTNMVWSYTVVIHVHNNLCGYVIVNILV